MILVIAMPATGYIFGKVMALHQLVLCTVYIYTVEIESLHSLMLDSLKGGVRVDYHA